MEKSPRFNFFRLVARNLKDRPYRNFALVLTFAIIAATLFSAQYLASGAAESLDRGTKWFAADLVVVPENETIVAENSLLTGTPSMFFLNNEGFEKISLIPGIARVSPQVQIATLSGESCCSGFVQLIAIDPINDFSLTRWLENYSEKPLGKDEIIVGSMIEGNVGSDLRFYGHSFHIAGRLGQTGMHGIDNAVFIRMEDAYTMAAESGTNAAKPLVIPRGMVSSVLVQLDPDASPDAVRDAIQQQIPGTRVLTPRDLSGTVTRHLSGITIFLHNAAIVLALLSIPGLLFISVLLFSDMKREVTILGTLGATKAFVLRLILVESFSSAIIGSIAGIGASVILLVAFQDLIAYSLCIPFGIPALSTIIIDSATALLLTLVIGGVASLYPAIRIVSSDAYQSIQE